MPRSGVMLLYADVRQWYRYGEWQAALANAALRVVSWRDISAEVQRGMERNSAQIAAVIEASAGWPLPHALAPTSMRRVPRQRARAPVWESPAYRGLDNGHFSYRMYCLAKATSRSAAGRRTMDTDRRMQWNCGPRRVIDQHEAARLAKTSSRNQTAQTTTGDLKIRAVFCAK